MVEFHSELVKSFGWLNGSMERVSKSLQEKGNKILDFKVVSLYDGKLIVTFMYTKKTQEEFHAEKSIPMSIEDMERDLMREHVEADSKKDYFFR